MRGSLSGGTGMGAVQAAARRQVPRLRERMAAFGLAVVNGFASATGLLGHASLKMRRHALLSCRGIVPVLYGTP